MRHQNTQMTSAGAGPADGGELQGESKKKKSVYSEGALIL